MGFSSVSAEPAEGRGLGDRPAEIDLASLSHPLPRVNQHKVAPRSVEVSLAQLK
jgi:hypothetical protein